MVNDANGRDIEKVYHFIFVKIINFQWGRFITVIFGLRLIGFKKFIFESLGGFVLGSKLV
jgi:hypothetical protein